MLNTINDQAIQINTFLWTPVIKGGGGIMFRNDSNITSYGGLFFRPHELFNTKNEIIFGSGFTNTDGKTDYEFQAEFRHHKGFSVGAGYINSSFFESKAGGKRSDDYFVKLSYRKKTAKLSHTESFFLQEFRTKKYLGGYITVYNRVIGVAGGYEGESWRVSANFTAKENKKFSLRPALEVLYIDKKIGGNTAAPKILWINGTLKFSGGFLSKDAWLGRAMGPTGMEYGNPLPYLIPLNDGSALFPGAPSIWNRALNIWEIGGVLNARLFHLYLPNKSKWGKADVVIFPAQLFKKRGLADSFFAGLTYFYNTNLPNSNPSIKDPIILGGFIKRSKKWNFALELEYDTKYKRYTSNIGIIRLI